MATRSELTQLLDNELQSIISQRYGVTDATPHVAPARTQDDQTLPSLNYETQVTPQRRGMHDESHVDELKYTDGSVSAIVFRDDKTLFFDVTASVGDDDFKEKDDLYSAVENWFDIYDGKRKQPEDLHSDIDELRVLGTSDESRPDDAVRGDRLSLEIDFSVYDEYTDFDTMESFTSNIETKDQISQEEQTIDYNHDINYTTN